MIEKVLKRLRVVLGYILFFISNRINLRLLWPLVGNVFETLRVSALRMMSAQIGQNSYLRAGLKIYRPQNLSVGKNCIINIDTTLFLFDRLQMGDNVETGPEFLVYTGDHHMNDPDKPLTKQGGFTAPVMIGNDVYIGSRVTVLQGVTIGDRVVVAAGAVVTEDLPGGFVYGGVPAKKIKALT